MGEVGPWLTPGGVLLLLGWSVVRGWLIPRRWHQERIDDYKTIIEDKNRTIAEQGHQLSILLGFSPGPSSFGGAAGSNGTQPRPPSGSGQRRRGNGQRSS